MKLLALSGAGLVFVVAWVVWSNQTSIWDQVAALLFAYAGVLTLWGVFTPDMADDNFEDHIEGWGDSK